MPQHQPASRTMARQPQARAACAVALPWCPSRPLARGLLPRAAETVFLLASLPQRADMPWWNEINEATQADLLRLAQASREDWLAVLDRAEHHPQLVTDGPAALDERLRWLVRSDPTGGPSGRLARIREVFQADPVLRLSEEVVSPGETERESELLLRVTSDHLLPRYLLDEAFGVLLHLIEPRPARSLTPTRAATWAVLQVPIIASIIALLGALIAAASPALTLVAGRVNLDLHAAFTTAALTLVYALRSIALLWVVAVAITVARGGRAGSYLSLLRLPAAVAFGLAIVSSLGPTVGPQAPLPPALPLILAAVALGYLAIEVVNQGAVGNRQVLVRSMLVGSIGLGIALLVTTLIGWVVGPSVMQSPSATADPAGHLFGLLLGSSAGLTVGVFLQAIWDESPVTSPLSRLRLR